MLKSASNAQWKPASAIELFETCKTCQGDDYGTGSGGKADVNRCPLCGETGISRLPSHLPC